MRLHFKRRLKVVRFYLDFAIGRLTLHFKRRLKEHYYYFLMHLTITCCISREGWKKRRLAKIRPKKPGPRKSCISREGWKIWASILRTGTKNELLHFKRRLKVKKLKSYISATVLLHFKRRLKAISTIPSGISSLSSCCISREGWKEEQEEIIRRYIQMRCISREGWKAGDIRPGALITLFWCCISREGWKSMRV